MNMTERTIEFEELMDMVENYCNGGHGSCDVERITEEWKEVKS